ncbi:Ferredoxin-like protein in nif region [Folsomia candida]|uniref:Ferredoxin-like protein in nif region n=1 Tax=Folsomia candida TaxID=158441 RepID=A0A226D6X3_FOLCA|nr:Ferredoxin-like protein in nif region [Folsomia candida]
MKFVLMIGAGLLFLSLTNCYVIQQYDKPLNNETNWEATDYAGHNQTELLQTLPIHQRFLHKLNHARSKTRAGQEPEQGKRYNCKGRIPRKLKRRCKGYDTEVLTDKDKKTMRLETVAVAVDDDFNVYVAANLKSKMDNHEKSTRLKTLKQQERKRLEKRGFTDPDEIDRRIQQYGREIESDQLYYTKDHGIQESEYGTIYKTIEETEKAFDNKMDNAKPHAEMKLLKCLETSHKGKSFLTVAPSKGACHLCGGELGKRQVPTNEEGSNTGVPPDRWHAPSVIPTLKAVGYSNTVSQ